MLSLRKAAPEDCASILRIQRKAFAPLLLRYRDYQSSPAAESQEDILRRLAQSFTDYYLICIDDAEVGMIRVCNFGAECRISPICILPEYQGRGYAHQAIRMAEQRYPGAAAWTLETILQEQSLCRLYESLGYEATGRVDPVQNGMDLVYYRKDMKHHA